MHTMRKTVLEVLVLIVIGALAAVTANAVRATGSVKFTRNHFDKGLERTIPPPGIATTASRRAARARVPSLGV